MPVHIVFNTLFSKCYLYLKKNEKEKKNIIHLPDRFRYRPKISFEDSITFCRVMPLFQIRSLGKWHIVFTFIFFSCREQLQQQHTDFMATRRELAHVNRENERFQRELEEFRAIVEVNKCKTLGYWTKLLPTGVRPHYFFCMVLD